MVIWSGAVNRWWYQPGEVTPAPYPLAFASRPCVQGTHVQATLRFGRPFRIRWSCVAGGNGSLQRRHMPGATDDRDPLEALFDCLAQRRAACRPRAAPRARSPPRHAATRVIASAITVNGSAPSRRCSITSSHQRSGSSYPPAAASVASGSADNPRRPPAPSCRTGTPPADRRTAPVRRPPARDRIACHSGLNTANGQNAALRRVVDRVGQQRDRRHHLLVTRPARPPCRPRAVPRSARCRDAAPPGQPQRPGRPRTVVPDAEEVNDSSRDVPARPVEVAPSRPARGRRSPGTPTRPPDPPTGPSRPRRGCRRQHHSSAGRRRRSAPPARVHR